MATKDDITEMVKYHRTKKVFEPQYFGGKTTENEKEFLSSFNNYCKLNKIDGQEKILMFEMSLFGSSKCWYLTLSDTIKKDFESITELFNHDYLQNNQWLNTTRLENRKLLNTESAEKYISGKLIEETNLIWVDSSKRVTNENGFNGFRINRSMFCNKKVRLLVTWCEVLVNY